MIQANAALLTRYLTSASEILCEKVSFHWDFQTNTPSPARNAMPTASAIRRASICAAAWSPPNLQASAQTDCYWPRARVNWAVLRALRASARRRSRTMCS